MSTRKDLFKIRTYAVLICSLLSGSDGTLSIFVLYLAQCDTPIHRWNLPSLPKDFSLFIKRDDMTGSTLSGNKVHRLEFTT